MSILTKLGLGVAAGALVIGGVGVLSAASSTPASSTNPPPGFPKPPGIPCGQSYENGAWQAPIPDKPGADPKLCIHDERIGSSYTDPKTGLPLMTPDGKLRRYSMVMPPAPVDPVTHVRTAAAQAYDSARDASIQAAHIKYGGPVLPDEIEVAPTPVNVSVP